MYRSNNCRRHSKDDRLFSILLGTLIALVVADGIISEFIIIGGVAREGNPLLLPWIGNDLFLAIKLLGAFLASVSLSYVYRHHAKLSQICVVFFITFYTAVVYWNLVIALQAQL
ncbi:DUF5658 family protein [Chloroflexota bacterium]